MFELGNIICFLLGGLVGFFLACILAAGARAELMRKYQDLLSKAYADRRRFSADRRKAVAVSSGSDYPTGTDG